jgi:hypothetical protein
MTFSLHRSVRAILSILTLACVLFSGTASAATYTLAPLAYQTVLDTNGNPVSGAKICTYLAGTTTPTATYSDSIGTPNLNPITADSSGRFVAYLLPGASYKFIFQDATGTAATCNGVVLRTQDNITAVPPASGNVDVTGTAGEALTAGQAVYLSDGSGSKAAGQWYKADAANGYSSTLPTIGMAPSSISSGAAGTIRLFGSVTGLSTLSISAKYYVGTAGALTSSPATGGRFLGIADSSTSLNLTPQAPVPQPWTVISTTSTGTQNDFAPGLIGNTVVRCNNATLLTISGLSGGYDGQRIVLVSIGAGQVDLAHQNASSSAANRFINFVTVGVTSLAPGSGTAELVYDATTARWRLAAHEQGAWITRTFAAGNYTASAGNWTVASATRDAFYLRGRTLSFAVAASGTTSGTPVSVKVTLPQSYSAASSDIGASYTSNAGAGSGESGYQQASTTTLNFQRLNNVAFAAGTVAVNAVAVFEIQ